MSKLFKNEWIYTVMNNLNFKKFTDIQKKTIPLILKNKNVIGVSQTGTGKTYCFLFPIFDSIDINNKNVQSIIIVPTRELAKQIYNKSKDFLKVNKNINLSLLIGGSETDKKMQSLSNQPPHILIATPKKMNDFLTNHKINLTSLKNVVLDEADMLIDLGFFGLIDNIFNYFKKTNDLQKIAFSATLHETLSIQLSKYFTNSEIVNHSKSIWDQKKVKHVIIHYNEDKYQLFEKLISQINPYFCIIFANTKKDVDKLYDLLYNKGLNVGKLHGDLLSRERKNIFKEIENNKLVYLVATDLASRGLDIDGASHVISWDMPKEDIWYIHRSGRTGRYNYEGNSFIFLDKNTEYQVLRLQKKGINFQNKKFIKNELIDFDYKFREKIKKETDVDIQIKKIINTANKKVKPNYKKKINLKIKEVKRKAKRNRIEELVNKERIKRYKIENAKKSKLKNS